MNCCFVLIFFIFKSLYILEVLIIILFKKIGHSVCSVEAQRGAEFSLL